MYSINRHKRDELVILGTLMAHVGNLYFYAVVLHPTLLYVTRSKPAARGPFWTNRAPNVLDDGRFVGYVSRDLLKGPMDRVEMILVDVITTWYMLGKPRDENNDVPPCVEAVREMLDKSTEIGGAR